jgi:hypothetical protein
MSEPPDEINTDEIKNLILGLARALTEKMPYEQRDAIVRTLLVMSMAPSRTKAEALGFRQLADWIAGGPPIEPHPVSKPSLKIVKDE